MEGHSLLWIEVAGGRIYREEVSGSIAFVPGVPVLRAQYAPVQHEDALTPYESRKPDPIR